MLSVTLDIDASQAIKKLEKVNGLLDEMVHKLNVLNQNAPNDDIVVLRELGQVQSIHDLVNICPTITVRTETKSMSFDEIVDRISETIKSEMGIHA
ncbi:hypothetical protein EHV15_05115 [Paenibacillus oralis]|uniref:Uncharacterized protein n=1 Tax=Paenibacillus oralis TaxID=2490856 RepID=A0A3P3TYH2_9BACL|nr:hypothetical protein [Paenibacillus oralis]RRJ62399.1 hypothetical protein EHV15_05115 [Paenibacillus oralis]